MDNLDPATNSVVFCRTSTFAASVEKIDADTGEAEVLGSDDAFAQPMPVGGPWLREISIPFGNSFVTSEDPDPVPEEVTFEPGDELRVRVFMDEFCTIPPTPHPSGDSVVYSDSQRTPSRVFLGNSTREIRPGTFEACQEIRDNAIDSGLDLEPRLDCSWIGGARQNVPLRCFSLDYYKVVWEGPPGSGAMVQCGGATATCTVPAQAGDTWGTCEATTRSDTTTGEHSVCTYFTESGEQVEGEGYCTVLRTP